MNAPAFSATEPRHKTETTHRLELPTSLIVRNRQELKADVIAAIDARASRVILDFSATRFVDSSGLGVLVSVNKICRDCGVALALRGLSPDLRALFERYRLDTLFCIEDGAATTEGGATNAD